MGKQRRFVVTSERPQVPTDSLRDRTLEYKLRRLHQNFYTQLTVEQWLGTKVYTLQLWVIGPFGPPLDAFHSNDLGKIIDAAFFEHVYDD